MSLTAHELGDRLQLNTNERLFVMLYWTEQLNLAECAAVLGITKFAAAAMQRSITVRAHQAIAADST